MGLRVDGRGAARVGLALADKPITLQGINMTDLTTIPVGTILRVTHEGLEVLPGDGARVPDLGSPGPVVGGPASSNSAPALVEAGTYYPDDSPVWLQVSNGQRLHGRSCEDPRVAAEGLELWADQARRFTRLLAGSPGVPLAWTQVADELGLDGSRAVAGVLNGFTKAHDERRIAFPFSWWEGDESRPTMYGMRPAVAAGVAEALEDYVERITFKSEAWFQVGVVEAFRLLLDRVLEGEPISYGDFADELKRRVPGLKIAARGRVMGAMLGAVCRFQTVLEAHANEEYPVLTAVVTNAGGGHGSGFLDMADAKRLEGESDDELERRMMAQVFTAWRDPAIREIVPEAITEWRSNPERWESGNGQ